VRGEDGRAHDQDDLVFAEDIAQRAALALNKARLHELERAARLAAEAAQQELRKANELMERLLGIVGHDLRNPLGAIGVAAHSLLRRGVPDWEERMLRRITGSVERMDRMINQLLDLARVRQGGGLSVVPTETDLVEVVRRVAEEAELLFPGSRVELRSEGRLVGRWDADRISELFSNLIGNALQHGEGRVVTVALRGEGEDATAEVHNTGAAIPPELLPLLFDPFRRGREAQRGRAAGLGLGLYIANQIALAHRGRLEVRSPDGDGTSFVVRLPLRRGAR
jgi:signal transduction histidine kinase